jgi:hypothetical protein
MKQTSSRANICVKMSAISLIDRTWSPAIAARLAMSRAFRNQSALDSSTVTVDAVGLEEIRIALTVLKKGFMVIEVCVRKGRVAG